ncbi:MAG: hypothetical protein ABIJ39_12675 [Chloroflexota bacterium]
MDGRLTPRGQVTPIEDGWQFTLPEGKHGSYRLAQLDDYTHLPRGKFPNQPERTLSLRARVSAADLPGTWGFGLWNDPFGLSLGFGATAGRVPVLPQAVWFFHASPPNHLSLRDDIPAFGFFAGVIRSPRIATTFLAPLVIGLPSLLLRPVRQTLRRLTGKIIRQDGAAIKIDVTRWHNYSISWRADACTFEVDNRTILHTTVSPAGPLGLVLWIDNQYAAWTPAGQLGFGSLENTAMWIEICELTNFT